MSPQPVKRNELTGVEKSPVFPVSASNLEPDSWSPVNRFFPQGCVRSPPIVLNSKAASLPTSAPPFIQSSSITPLEADHTNSDSASAGSQSLPSPTLTVIMAIETFNNKFKEITKVASNVNLLIDCCNADTVTLLDRDDYKTELLVTLQGKVIDLQESLDENIDEQNKLLDDSTTVMENTKKKVVQNSIAIKQQILKLIEESEASRSSTTADEDCKKLTLKVKNATIKFRNLCKEVEEIGASDSLTDHQIRESLAASKDWKKDLKVYENLKEALDIDMLTTTVENDIENDFKDSYKNMVETVTAKMEELLLLDKNLGFYSLAEAQFSILMLFLEVWERMSLNSSNNFVKL